MPRKVKNPKRDPRQTLVAARILTGSVTDPSVLPFGRTMPAHDRKKLKQEEPENVSKTPRARR